MSFAAGQTLSFYEILDPLGTGSMGEVYRARDTRLGREVAIKVLPSHFAAEDERLLRFEREAKSLASLNHPNVAQIFGVDQVDDTYFLVIEFVPGETLEDRIARGALPLDEALDVCRQIAEGLEAAHEAGVVHRDLKPANVRITAEGRVKVLDFGLAKVAEPSGYGGSTNISVLATEEGRLLGTPTYMSPEQARGKVVDRRTDIWAFGCVLYECLVGTRAFDAVSFADLLAAIVSREPDWFRLPDGLSSGVRQLLLRCLEKDDHERLRDVGEARVILGRALLGDDKRPASTAGVDGASVECRFTLKTEHVRDLDRPVPRLIGDELTYLDNERVSETLVVFLPGLGLDERMFSEVLQKLPHRGIALSLYGFGRRAQYRPSLSIEDHNRLLSVVLGEVNGRVRPKQTVLVGFSSGADQALSLVTSAASADLSFDGLLLLSPTANIRMTSVLRAYADLPEEPAEILSVLKAYGSSNDSLEGWLRMQSYFVQSFEKFALDPKTLRDYSRQWLDVFEKDESGFFRRFRAAIERVRNLRCVFAAEEIAEVDWILRHHLEADVLGPGYTEEMIDTSAIGHMLLADHESLRSYLAALLAALGKEPVVSENCAGRK